MPVIRYVLLGFGFLALIIGMFFDGSLEYKGSDFGSFFERSSDDTRDTDLHANGQVVFEKLTIDTESLEEIRIVDTGDAIVKISGSVFKTEDEIIIEKYKGKITYENNVSLSGRADKITIGNNVFQSPKFEASGLGQDDLILSDIVDGSFTFTVEEGHLSLNDRIEMQLEGEVVELNKFDGNLELNENTIDINGTVRKININGGYEINFFSKSSLF